MNVAPSHSLLPPAESCHSEVVQDSVDSEFGNRSEPLLGT